MDRFQNFISFSKAAVMFLNAIENVDHNAEFDAESDYTYEALIRIIDEKEDYPEFSESINLHFQTMEATDTNEILQIDINQTQNTNSAEDAFYPRFSIHAPSWMHATFATAYSSIMHRSLFMFIDTEAPKTICSDTFLAALKHTPAQTHLLSPSVEPFSFALHPVLPPTLASLVAKITNNDSSDQNFCQVQLENKTSCFHNTNPSKFHFSLVNKSNFLLGLISTSAKKKWQ